ncbi:SH3 domain-containing RING finger protein 3-like protein [Dinothrombium tinctorium]|uniref:RING-type E3 ubiquitin transferase n=1 Tax=Dinothrombium tinctorium TaxID=1965070 RepID=A0A443QV62_9ACAR|nr:SH3 domain-containing RING finger protein 3-like protein [Dinothrombium tinctorium]
MDESHFWTDLLECSVCLEQLDINNKVLPCQHTFCKKCLNRIVNTHKELRCPECRVEVDVKVDDLPTNILLVRLLEGIKNNPKLSLTQQKNASNSSNGQPFAGFKPAFGNELNPFLQTQSNVAEFSVSTTQTQAQQMQQQQQSLPLSNREISQQKPNTTVKPSLSYSSTSSSSSNFPRAKALFNYDGKEQGDLSFKKGDVIVIRRRIDPNWFYGECNGKQGYLPASYVQVLVPPTTPVPPQCKALYDFRVTDVEEKDCLSFNKGEIITVIRRVDENWAEGKLNERVGIFPISFVEMNVAAKALMKLSNVSVIGPSRTAPPTPLLDAATSKTNTEVPSVDDSSTSSCSSSTASPSSAPCTPSSTSSSSSSLGLGTNPATTVASSVTIAATSLTSTNINSSVKSPSLSQSPTVYDKVFIQRSATSNQKRHSLCVPPAGSHGLPLPYQRTNSQSNDGSNSSVTQAHRHSMEILSNETGANINEGNSSSNSDMVRNSNVRSSWRRETSLLETRVPVSHSPPVPLYYVAMYNYKPQKSDEIELRKGELYTVNEKCQDGWYKGTSLRTGVSGVFPGNYVQIAKSSLPQPQHNNPQTSQSSTVPPNRMLSPACELKKVEIAPPPRPRPIASARTAIESTVPSTSFNTSTTSSAIYARPRPVPSSSSATQGIAGLFDWAKSISAGIPTPPQRPPRSSYVTSPTLSNGEDTNVTSCHISPQWHQPKVAATRHNASTQQVAITTRKSASPTPSSVGCGLASQEKEKKDQKREKISLMKRLTSKRKSKSPPPVTNGFSCDNPSFVSTSPPHNLVLANPGTSNLPTVHIRSGSCPNEALRGPQHKKTSSCDDTNKCVKQLIKERYRCIVPYPPNTEYELELQVGDIVYVHKKRDDGWYKGTHEKSGKVGLFPSSFVESFQ